MQEALHVASPVENAINDHPPADGPIDEPVRFIMNLPVVVDAKRLKLFRDIAAIGKFAKAAAGFLDGGEEAVGLLNAIMADDIAVNVFDIPLGVLGEH